MKKLFKVLLLPLVLLIMLFTSFQVYSKDLSLTDNIIKRGVIKVGMSSFVPWAFRDNNGEYVGFEIDIAKKLADDMGVELQLVPTAWDGLIPALQAGKLDVIIAGMSVTVKRNLSVNFTVPYSGSEYVVIGRKDNINNDKLNTKQIKIAVRRGSVPAITAKKLYPQAKLLQFDDDGVALQEVVNGNADITLDVSSSAADYLAKYNNLILLNDGKAVEKGIEAFALKKGDSDALNFFNNWIAIRSNDGFIDNRFSYWFRSIKWKKDLNYE